MLENPNIRAPIAISLGAIAGALGRYYLGQGVAHVWDAGFPVGTLVVNLSGCFFMGFITTVAMHRGFLKPELFLVIATGFLGSYTTFSSYELEVARLVNQLQLKHAFGYGLGSPVLGLISLSLGIGLAKIAFPKPDIHD